MTHYESGRPILLLSLPRAGSTWTANVLSRSAGVRYVSEPADAYRWPAAFWAKLGMAEYPTKSEAIGNVRFQKLWETVLNRTSYFDQARLGANILPRIHPPLIRWAIKPRQVMVVDSLQDAGVECLGRPVCKERLLIKEVTISFCGGLVADWLGADVLVIRRDPSKVAASWQKMGFPPEPVYQQPWVAQEVIQSLGIVEPSPTSHVERLAWTVGLLDLAMMREAKARKWHVVAHETLATDPENEFRNLVQVLDLQATDQMWQFLKDSHASHGSGYSTSRTTEQIRDSSKGVFSASDQANLDAILHSLEEYLTSAVT